MNKVRVRFAPSPTGPLHIGGVRTALYNYLFAKGNGGSFILRIEDTDRERWVESAEKYIMESLNWLGINPNEGLQQGGDFGPYRQSDRQEIYSEYADQLLANGNAYIAFDTQEEIEQMKAKMEEAGVIRPQYNAVMRGKMRNSLTMSEQQVKEEMDKGTPYVVRAKIPAKEDIRFQDMVRGWIVVHSSTLDDKVLVKSDGMPTYHLANIVDDHLMEITHVIRGEEWLPSAPLHVLLYRFFGWENEMPEFGHLPLIMKPNGKGKLSKRDGQKQGIPVFPLEWTDDNGDILKGFREEGFYPEAVNNFLALLGWNPGTEQEVFTLEELSKQFSMDRIIKGGARFDMEKARWFNEQYLRGKNHDDLSADLINYAKEKNINLSTEQSSEIILMMKERVTFIHEMIENAPFLFQKPQEYDRKVIKKRWNEELKEPLLEFATSLEKEDKMKPEDIKNQLQSILDKFEMPMGKLMQVLRVTLTGEAGGPDLMSIISYIGGRESADRIKIAVERINEPQ